MQARWEKGTVDPMGNRHKRIKQVREMAGLSQEEFARALSEVPGIKVTRGAVGNWELSDDNGISRANLAAICSKFGVDLNWLELGNGPSPTPAPIESKDKKAAISSITVPRQLMSKRESFVHNARLGSPIEAYARVPIRGQSMGGKTGALIFTADDNFGEIEAPPKLYGVPDAYAVYVIGDSMLDRFRHGEVVFVHPYEPIKKDDDVVVQIMAAEGGSVVGYVKRFVSQDDHLLKVRQLHPKKTLTFAVGTVVAVHKIVMAGAL